MSCYHIALGILGAAASYLAATGLETYLGVPLAAAIAGSVALHLAWISAAAQHRLPLLVLVCWPFCLSYASDGASRIFSHRDNYVALVLELAALLLARSLTPGKGWPERLASLRRQRNAVFAQWALFTDATGGGSPDRDHDRLMAELDDAEELAARASANIGGNGGPRARR